jgi:membrane fusion protein, multidrug efflux system
VIFCFKEASCFSLTDYIWGIAFLNQHTCGIASSLVFLGFFGCGREEPKLVQATIPTVSVSRPVVREVVEYEHFTGRTAAQFSVEIRSRVAGYLKEMPFKEGEEVKKGDLLFKLDEEPYLSQLRKAQSDLDLNKARLKLAQSDNQRAKEISKTNAGAISQQDLDKYEAAEEEADAAVKASAANLDFYQVNFDFTSIKAPIDGQVGRYNYTVGNLVTADMTTLTTIVSQDPIYAYFDVDEQTLLKVGRRLLERQVDLKMQDSFPVMMALGDEVGFPHLGQINFVDNVISSSTGTLTLRGVFANPANPFGKRLLRPGMFVKVQLPVKKPSPKLLVSERALGSDQGRKFVMVVEAPNTVKSVPITVGSLQDDGLRVVETGLSQDDMVIVSGLQFVRPKSQVKMEEVPMVGSKKSVDGATAPAPDSPLPLPPSALNSSAFPSDASPSNQQQK